LNVPKVTIVSAEFVSAGSFTLPDQQYFATPASLTDVPPAHLDAFCRVLIKLSPSDDSVIKVEVWLPAVWNGKFMAVGNGGWAGTISDKNMSAALARGYATASTDTGHEGINADARFALGHPEKLIDFGYRAVHEMTITAKTIIGAYYGSTPKLSYWNGCSTGGKQGLKEAQRFPADFDAVVAGAPSNNWTHLNAQFIWVAQAMHKDEASYILPAKYKLIHDAVLKACDARDGVRDGVLENPVDCKFDPKLLECSGVDGPGCLSASQVEAARTVYGASVNPRTREQIYPGLVPGSELGWAAQAGPQPVGIPYSYFRYVVFKDPSWDYRRMNFDTDLALAEQADNGIISATDPNLDAFFSRGGKLLQYHGWADNQISPLNSIDYYQSVVTRVGSARKVSDSYRLFMIPGMGHCSGGEGVNNFDSISVIERWAEQGKAPASIAASRIFDGKAIRTRLLCPYPQVAVYKGKNSDQAESFACKFR
jgi:feruloyl esterase